MATEDDNARILVELGKLNSSVETIRREGIDRGRKQDANHKILTETVRIHGERLSTLEERVNTQQRNNSGFHRGLKQASETDAKMQSDLAAIMVALDKHAATRNEQQTGALGSLIVRTVQSIEPSKRAKLGNAALQFFLAISILAGVLANYLQGKGH